MVERGAGMGLNAFNPLKNWYDADVIGIDTGITMLMAENARTGFVWETFMKNPEARHGMERAGFKPDRKDSNATASALPGAGREGIPRNSEIRPADPLKSA